MAKLTLDMDIEPTLIEKIRQVAKERNLSLAELTKNLYKEEAEKEVKEPIEETLLVKNENLSDWVKSLMLAKVPTPDFDAKKEYGDHIMKKHGL